MITIARMLGHFRTLLEEVSANPDQRLTILPLMTAAERHQLLVQWNSTNRDYPRDKCVHELFEEQAERTPDSVAIALESQQLTYAELNVRANQLAHYLRSLGVSVEVLVGICVERSLEMLVGLLGILKAGGAYVPLDSRSPRDRLNFMLEDTRTRILLTQQHLLAELPDVLAEVICLDRDWKIIEQESQKNPIRGTNGQHIAYVIYTSGSTGRPKGVMIEHRSLVNYLFWVNESLRKDQGLSLPTVSGLTFDASLKQLFAPLLRGGEVWILSDEIVTSPDALLQVLGTRSKAGLNCVPSLWKAILDIMSSGQVSMRAENLKCLFLGGERFERGLVERTLHVLPNLQIWNLYGPTEATANTSAAKITSNGDVTIGRPVANTQVYILDSYQQPVPVGIPGELYIGGEGLARGYLKRPGLTAERFVVNPFSKEPGSRLYQTGDLARYLPDGSIEFLGRLDHQVKIRGYRVELEEIEAVLGQLPGVQETVVMAQELGSDHSRLVAYVVPTQKPASAAWEWRSLLREKLPEYMLPAAFVLLDALPVMPNGKIDRKALPAPEDLQTHREGVLAAPRTELERTLAAVWQEVLQVESVGVNENFFELGGHSLLTVKVHQILRGILNRDLSVIDLFRHPTISSLANHLSQRQSEPPCFQAGCDRAETRRRSMGRQREFREGRRIQKFKGV